MTFLRVLGQMVLLSTAILHLTASLPLWERVQDGNDLEGMLKTDISYMQSLLARSYADALVEATLSQTERRGLERRRQLGDIEFSNRYAEFLRSRAQHTSICAFLRRLQSIKKSGLGGETERVNALLKQYTCPNVYPWSSDL